MFKKGARGVNGFLKNVKKTAMLVLFLIAAGDHLQLPQFSGATNKDSFKENNV